MATGEKNITPWTRTIISGVHLLREPKYNKSTAFTADERKQLKLRGLLPPRIVDQDLQVDRAMNNLRMQPDPLAKYVFLMALCDRNEHLFYRVLQQHLKELMPIVYTPTVGAACQQFGAIFRRPRGLYVSIEDLGEVHSILKNWPEKDIAVIVVTDGERILGLGDLGANGMGIPVGKLSLYTACAGVPPMKCLPVTLDVGTNNKDLLNDPFYIGLNRERERSEKYDQLIEEFFQACQKRFGQKVVIQFEDFGNSNAFRLLKKYQDRACTFNDDIQGTASVAVAGLLSSLRVAGGELADKTFVFLGAGEAGTGIADLIAETISNQTGKSLEESRKNIWLIDSKGLVVASRKADLVEHKLHYAHEHEALPDLLSVVKNMKPHYIIGVSAQPNTFTKEVCETMATNHDRPGIFALSNPTSKAECTAQQAYEWTNGKCLFASGSPFDPVTLNGKTYVPGQGNNAYVFPGIGMGIYASGSTRIPQHMFYVAAKALSDEVSEEDLASGCLYPNLDRIREVSLKVAAAVAESAYELNLASKIPKPENMLDFVSKQVFTTDYPSFI